ncbi:MAG TPA: cyclopropane-fatty-acyl-phospholipid synthase family protein [Acidimicrobiia bacterium]|nr:cyclopropane-fatty-acyl-phospholipid synthase family protein [Acidimicrobiia bacterium]
MRIADFVAELLGADLPIRIDCYDGSSVGPAGARTRLVVRSPDALSYLLTAPGELGFGRAYVSGALALDGDIFEALELRERLPNVEVHARMLLDVALLAGRRGLRRPPIPAEEARLHGLRHTQKRDAAAIAHHYDVSNEFYELVLGPSMTYSCAVWEADTTSLTVAQNNKYELICRKLALEPGMRLLDVGCGWGGMVRYAAEHYGVRAVGVTLSRQQADFAIDATKAAGLDDRVEIRVQDYREVTDGPYDAISSIGMFEHVGLARLDEYFGRLYALLRPEGRLLNHGISRRPGGRARFRRKGFIDRYVFPDGELHEIGVVVSRVQRAAFEVRHVESLREHYALTLRHWVANLEANWNDAIALVGEPRARVWRLYMAASAVNFEAERNEIHQTLAVRPAAGRSGMPRRPDWDRVPLSSLVPA